MADMRTKQEIQRTHDYLIQNHITTIHRTIHGLDIILKETDVLVREYADEIHRLTHQLDNLLEKLEEEAGG